MPISSDKFIPPEDCAAEQALISGSELRVIEDVHGHAALFGLAQDYADQVDKALGELLAQRVPERRTSLVVEWPSSSVMRRCVAAPSRWPRSGRTTR
jgi:hypothetical protein